MPDRHFASDNNAGVHPDVLAALSAANDGHATAYGDDEMHAPRRSGVPRAARRRGARVLRVQRHGRERGRARVGAAAVPRDHLPGGRAPRGGRVRGVRTLRRAASSSTCPWQNGKLTPDDVERNVRGVGDQHHVQPGAISISQSTEVGTVYTRRRAARARRGRAQARPAVPPRRRAHRQRRGVAGRRRAHDAGRHGRRRVHVRRHEERHDVRRGDRVPEGPSGGRRAAVHAQAGDAARVEDALRRGAVRGAAARRAVAAQRGARERDGAPARGAPARSRRRDPARVPGAGQRRVPDPAARTRSSRCSASGGSTCGTPTRTSPAG